MPPKKSAKSGGAEPATTIPHEQIAERARALWQERGQPEGRDMDHWLEAERELRDRRGKPRGKDQPSDEELAADRRVDGLEQRPRDR